MEPDLTPTRQRRAADRTNAASSDKIHPVARRIASLEPPADAAELGAKAFLRARDLLTEDIAELWRSSLERIGTATEDQLSVLDLWVCLVVIEEAYMRDADNALAAEWEAVARARALLFGLAARALGQTLDRLPEPAPGGAGA